MVKRNEGECVSYESMISEIPITGDMHVYLLMKALMHTYEQ